MKEKFLVVCGGTGGHVFPANMIAKIFGGDLFVEKRIFNKIRSHLQDGAQFFELHYTIWSILLNIYRFYWLVEQYDVVLGTGSVYTIPALIAGFLRQKTLLVHEQNATIGYANQFAIYFLGANLLSSFENTGGYNFGIPIQANVVTTYNGPPYILVFAGSLGSDFMDSLAPAISNYAKKHNLIVYHQARNMEKVQAIYGSMGKVEQFFSNFNYLLEHASLVISRAGASTISYLQLLNKRAILIPFAGAQCDHQLLNAQWSGFPHLEEKNIDFLSEHLKNIAPQGPSSMVLKIVQEEEHLLQ